MEDINTLVSMVPMIKKKYMQINAQDIGKSKHKIYASQCMINLKK